jgi:hypothetical protein
MVSNHPMRIPGCLEWIGNRAAFDQHHRMTTSRSGTSCGKTDDTRAYDDDPCQLNLSHAAMLLLDIQ